VFCDKRLLLDCHHGQSEDGDESNGQRPQLKRYDFPEREGSMHHFSSWISVASFLVSVAATLIAGSSLHQAKQVAEQSRKDWKLRKWFDLYLSASGIYDSLDRFQAQYVFGNSPTNQEQRNRDLSDLMTSIRKVHAMAAVFPRAQAITDLFDATAAFKDADKEVGSKERLKKIGEAVEGLREQALFVDKSVLE
jgi:hypothetical protein